MPSSRFFLEAFLAGAKAPFTIPCASKADARRRQGQLLNFRREYREQGPPWEKEPGIFAQMGRAQMRLDKINSITVTIQGTNVVLVRRERQGNKELA